MKKVVLCIFLLIFLVACVQKTRQESVEGLKTVTKVIDGDTVIVEGGHTVRLLGIDADERGKPCYRAAKQRLEELVLDKKVSLERGKEDRDKYGRYLRYLFIENQNVALVLVQEGLAIARFQTENGKYNAEIAAAEKAAMESRTGCKWK